MEEESTNPNTTKMIDSNIPLESMNMTSISIRLERYRIIYTRKILNGDMPNCGLQWYDNKRRGNIFNITYSPNGASEHVRGIRLNSY